MQTLPFLCARASLAFAPFLALAAEKTVTLKMSVIDSLVPQLALGYFQQEGLALQFVKPEEFSKEDYLMQEPLHRGRSTCRATGFTTCRLA